MMWIRKKYYIPFINLTKDPEKNQWDLLKYILNLNKDTHFGRNHKFISIHSYKDFKNAVPINEYEDLRSYINQQEKTGEPYLNSQQPVMYAQTSGTTGEPKNIPILNASIESYKHSQSLFSYTQYSYDKEVYSGKLLAIVSPDIEGTLSTGTPYGAISGLIYKSMPTLLRYSYLLPFEIFTISDYDLKYYLICAFALSSENITLIATPNPSTILRLKDIIDTSLENLLEDIESGNLSWIKEIDPEKKQRINSKFKPNQLRASQLRELKKKKGSLIMSDIWPNLRLITTWTSGNCSTLLPSLKAQLSSKSFIGEVGYMSSEFRGTVNLDIRNEIQVPTLNENFFEFVERDEWGSESPVFLMLHEIELSKDYYIFVTTQNGLYRYFINDIIQVTGKYHNTPTIKFIQKGDGVISLTGEKLYEDQVNIAVLKVINKYNLKIKFYVMVAYSEELKYRLYIQQPFKSDYAQEIEQEISHLNIEYMEKRKSGRLMPLEVICVEKETAEEFKKYNLDKGQREGQFKLIRLLSDKDCDFDFNKFCIRE
ncbi:MAG: GH3 auxin-responsive promoter family protein [Verrucomicrobiota bacterium]|nr:GH3 auxin-responsive promoter family protein [Verrucomicrobiota bacterium]